MEGPRKRKRFLFEETIEVLVGGEEVKFVVHRDAICERSKFFAAAVSERWNDAQRPIKLLEESPKTFSTYLKRIYCQSLDQSTIERSDEGDDSGNETDKEEDYPGVDFEAPLRRLVRLYALSDKLEDLRMVNEVMDAISIFSYKGNCILSPHVVRLIWYTTPENSPLRRYARDVCVWHASESALEEANFWVIPKPFLLAVAQEYRRLFRDLTNDIEIYNVFNTVDKSQEHRCRYHQHDDSCPPYEIKSQEGTVEGGT